MLRHQANTGFGKMVLAGIRTEPQYSIGKAQRSPIYEIIKMSKCNIQQRMNFI